MIHVHVHVPECMQTRLTTAVTNGKQRKSKRGKLTNLDVQEREKENEEQGDLEEDGGLPAPSRSNYELQRAENIKKNLAILSDLGLVSLIVITLQWGNFRGMLNQSHRYIPWRKLSWVAHIANHEIMKVFSLESSLLYSRCV